MAAPANSARIAALRSPLGRVRGLGTAHAGARHWWVQRLTALALLPLTLWFICGAVRMEGASRADVARWLHGPLPLVLMLCLIVATFWHLSLGLQVVIEDYVASEPVRLMLLLLQRGAAIVLALFCMVAALGLGL
jgi:succinate dehydrogenase / fumarate reductase, membrane anchor subunit